MYIMGRFNISWTAEVFLKDQFVLFFRFVKEKPVHWLCMLIPFSTNFTQFSSFVGLQKNLFLIYTGYRNISNIRRRKLKPPRKSFPGDTTSYLSEEKSNNISSIQLIYINGSAQSSNGKRYKQVVIITHVV